jgi:RES domain-containing protein
LTPEDQALDPDFFLTHQPLTLYRLARARFANLSGIGAALAPGRWNRPDQEAIYTSTEVGVPLLERLVHTPKDVIPSNLALMKIRISGGWKKLDTIRMSGEWIKVTHLLTLGVENNRSYMMCFPTLAEAKSEFQANPWGGLVRTIATPFAVAVPSVIVPVWNVVLFPQATGFWDHVSLESVEPFHFDPRLFPEDSPAEPAEQDIAS